MTTALTRQLTPTSIHQAMEDPDYCRLEGVITPRTAKWLLEHLGKHDNRGALRKREQGVDLDQLPDLAELMNSDRWLPEYFAPMVISAAGVLMNGHHRLAAAVRFELSTAVVIAIGAPDSIYRRMDAGGQRSDVERAGEHPIKTPDKFVAMNKLIGRFLDGKHTSRVRRTILSGERILESHDNVWKDCYNHYRNTADVIYKKHNKHPELHGAVTGTLVLSLAMAAAGPIYDQKLWKRVDQALEKWQTFNSRGCIMTRASKAIAKRSLAASRDGNKLTLDVRVAILTAAMNAVLTERPRTQNELGSVQSRPMPRLILSWKV